MADETSEREHQLFGEEQQSVLKGLGIDPEKLKEVVQAGIVLGEDRIAVNGKDVGLDREE